MLQAAVSDQRGEAYLVGRRGPDEQYGAPASRARASAASQRPPSARGRRRRPPPVTATFGDRPSAAAPAATSRVRREAGSIRLESQPPVR
jgi:hypothetical protein